jgi:hypothetical protein
MTRILPRRALSSALLAALVLPISPALGQAPGCFHAREVVLAFTGEDARDRVTVTLIGPDCASAVVVLAARDASGSVVYQHAWPFAWFADNSGVSPAPDAALERVNPRIEGSAAALQPAAELENDFQWLEAPAEDVDRLRRAGGALFCYETGHEAGACAAFDPERGVGVRVLAHGV